MDGREQPPAPSLGSARFRKFQAALAGAGRGVLFLDFDGTLAPFQADPARVQPYPGVVEILDRIAGADRTRLVLVTGRSLQEGLPPLGMQRDVEIWGSHGRERQRPGEKITVQPIGEKAAAALAAVDEWADELDRLGARCELKPGAMAVHWRWLPFSDRLRVAGAIAALWAGFPMRASLARRGFDGGIEFRAPGFDKGDVVRTVLEEERGEPPCAYLGDDDTDEDAFAYLNGRGFTALVREEFRPTAAAAWLVPPDDVLAFLQAWDKAIGGRA
jgi:trehalose-phosphatase